MTSKTFEGLNGHHENSGEYPFSSFELSSSISPLIDGQKLLAIIIIIMFIKPILYVCVWYFVRYEKLCIT